MKKYIGLSMDPCAPWNSYRNNPNIPKPDHVTNTWVPCFWKSPTSLWPSCCFTTRADPFGPAEAWSWTAGSLASSRVSRVLCWLALMVGCGWPYTSYRFVGLWTPPQFKTLTSKQEQNKTNIDPYAFTHFYVCRGFLWWKMLAWNIGPCAPAKFYRGNSNTLQPDHLMNTWVLCFWNFPPPSFDHPALKKHELEQEHHPTG